MSLLRLVAAVGMVVLVCVEAIVLALPVRTRFPRWFAGLLFGVAGLGLLFSISAVRGWLVVSPELGLLFVEGGAMAYGSIVFLVLASAMSFGLLLPAIGHAVERPSRVFWSLLGSALVAAFAIASIRGINPADSSELKVHVYDLWSPALVLWLSVSLVESGLRAGRIGRASLRLGAHAFVIAAIAWVAMARFEFLHPSTAMLWRNIGLAALVLSVGGLPVWLVAVARSDGSQPRRSVAVAGATLATCAVLAFAWWMWPDHRHLGVWALWAGSVILIVLVAWRRRHRTAPTLPQPTVPRREQALMQLALVIMATSLFSVQVVDHGLITLGLLTGWVMLAESTGEGALSRYLRRLRAGSSADRSAWGLAFGQLRSALRDALGYVFRLVKKPFEGSSMLGGVAKALVGIVILIGLSEYPNAGTTIIGSFSVDSTAKQKDLGQAVANHLVFALHSLHEQLRPDVALVTAAGGAKDRGFRFVAAKDDAASLDSALAKQPDVDLGLLKVPLGVLAAPIKAPARWLFRVRVISGAVHEDAPRTTVLARSTSGDAWKVPLGLDAEAAPTGGRPPERREEIDTARRLAEQLALQIVASDRSAPAAGLTRSTEALEAFQLGWSQWSRFEIDEDLTALATAIKHFHDATTKDWQFALAHYRLARALQKARRPGAATEAFRASLRMNDQFGPGLIGLASILYDYDAYLASPPAAARVRPASPGGDENLVGLFRKNEAAQLWQKVVRARAGTVSSIDRASAYAGLCLRAHDVGLSLESSAWTLADVRSTLTDFSAETAFHAWTERRAMEQRIQVLRAESKVPMPAQQARMNELVAKHEALFDPVSRAEKAVVKALKELDALGADEARRALVETSDTLAGFTTAAPTDEVEAKKLTHQAIEQLDVAENQRQNRIPMQSLLTYFYCKRADRIYSTLADMRAQQDLRAGAARVAHLLGLTLERRHSADHEPPAPAAWSCMTPASLPRGPYSRAALRHYDRAVDVDPGGRAHPLQGGPHRQSGRRRDADSRPGSRLPCAVESG